MLLIIIRFYCSYGLGIDFTEAFVSTILIIQPQLPHKSLPAALVFQSIPSKVEL